MQLFNPIIAAGNADQRAKANEFIGIARLLVLARGDMYRATKLAEPRATERIKTILKSAVQAGGVGSWGSPLAEYPGIVSAFVESLNSYGAFDAMLSSMRRVPLRSRVSVTTVGASGTTVGEVQATPISSLTLAGHQLAVTKALAIVVVTDELLKIGDPFSQALFAAELRNAVAVETDRQFLSILTTGISPTATNGGTSIAVLQDLAGLAAAISTDSASKLFLIVEPSTAKAWSFKVTAQGEIAFPGMSPQGGSVGGVPVLVSGGVASGTMILVDANQVAAASDTIELSASNQALLELQTAPSSPPIAGALMQSLWQQNETALRALRFFGVERLRDTAVAVVNNLAYSGNSPN